MRSANVLPALKSRENTPLSPTMTEDTNAATKGRKSSVGTDADSLVPLLLAALGNPLVNFRIMASLDDEGRTQNSLEHKFRKWRQLGREIVEKHPEVAGPVTSPDQKKTRTAPVKQTKDSKGKGKQTNVGDEEDEDVEKVWAGKIKKEDVETVI